MACPRTRVPDIDQHLRPHEQFMPVLPATQARLEFSVTVVIVGAGACGLTAALTLADRGIESLVLERDSHASGSTSLSAGLIQAAGTRLQRASDIEDLSLIHISEPTRPY